MIQAQYQLKLNWDDTWHMDRPHFHEDVEILLSLSNGGDFFIEHELYPLQKGALFLIGEAKLHKSVVNEYYKRYVLHISTGMLQELSTPQSDFLMCIQNISGRCALLEPKQITELVSVFQRLEQPSDESFGSDIRQTMCLSDFLLRVISLFEAAPTEEQKLTHDFARISPILTYIQERIDQPLTLDGVASQFFINKYHLSHIFKSVTGFSVMEYIIHCRVLKARELLRTGMRVQDVGEAVGFRNISHFIRTFGKLTGASPKRYAKGYLQAVNVIKR